MNPRRMPPGRRSGGGTLLGLFIGLVIGVIAVAGVVWYINKAPLPFTTTGQQPKVPPPVGNKPATPEVPPVASAPVALPGKPGDPVPEKPRFDFYKILPGKAEAIPEPRPDESRPAESKAAPPGKATETKPIEGRLPETKAPDARASESKASDGKPADNRATSARTPETKAAEATRLPESTRAKSERENTLREPIYLQAGSFQNASDADNQKARLALIGAEARIQQVMLQDKVWYRVRLGPYHRMDEVNNLRADLARQGIEANVVKKD